MSLPYLSIIFYVMYLNISLSNKYTVSWRHPYMVISVRFELTPPKRPCSVGVYVLDPLTRNLVKSIANDFYIRRGITSSRVALWRSIEIRPLMLRLEDDCLAIVCLRRVVFLRFSKLSVPTHDEEKLKLSSLWMDTLKVLLAPPIFTDSRLTPCNKCTVPNF